MVILIIFGGVVVVLVLGVLLGVLIGDVWGWCSVFVVMMLFSVVVMLLYLWVVFVLLVSILVWSW